MKYGFLMLGLLMALLPARKLSAQLDVESKTVVFEERAKLIGLFWDERGGCISFQFRPKSGIIRVEQFDADFESKWKLDVNKHDGANLRSPDADPLATSLYEFCFEEDVYHPTAKIYQQNSHWVIVNRVYNPSMRMHRMSVTRIDTAGKYYEGIDWPLETRYTGDPDLDFWLEDTLVLVHPKKRGFLMEFIAPDSLEVAKQLQFDFPSEKIYSYQFAGYHKGEFFFLHEIKGKSLVNEPLQIEWVIASGNGHVARRIPIVIEIGKDEYLAKINSSKTWKSRIPPYFVHSKMLGWVDASRGEMWLFGQILKRKHIKKGEVSFRLMRCDLQGNLIKAYPLTFVAFPDRNRRSKITALDLLLALERSTDKKYLLFSIKLFQTRRQTLVLDDSLNIVEDIYTNMLHLRQNNGFFAFSHTDDGNAMHQLASQNPTGTCKLSGAALADQVIKTLPRRSNLRQVFPAPLEIGCRFALYDYYKGELNFYRLADIRATDR